MGGWTQVVTVEDRGVKTVFVSGQAGQGADFEAHVDSAFAQLERRLGQAGATVDDVAKIRIFVKDLDADLYRLVADARRRTFPEGSWPASTVAGVEALAREPMRVEIEAIAVVANDDADLTIERLQPANGYSGVVTVSAHGMKTIYVSGAVGNGDTLAAQASAVWAGIGERLEMAGATFEDLVKTTIYIVDYERERDMGPFRSSYPEALARAPDKPASTLLGVPALAADRFAIEIDAIAVVGDGAELRREHIEPAGNYTQAVTVQGNGLKTIYLSGQVGVRGDPLADQVEQVYGNIVRRLANAGAASTDLVYSTVHIAGYSPAALSALEAPRATRGLTGDGAPASTLLGIQSLYARDALVEIGGIAVTRR
jgi:enamine deaminase RidA (YjgF/YER057c/UK114 family)